MQFKKWSVNPVDKNLSARIAEECDISPFVALIATGRGYTDFAELDLLLSDEVMIGDPFELADMEKAVDVISDAIYNDETIAIFGDYDVDGITATAILYTYLKNRGAKVIYEIPDRVKDGYGMNIFAIDKFIEQNVSLIITVDNGISCHREVEYAKENGIKVVVTDHHLPSGDLPKADAVVDPHREDDFSEFKEICGAFVAFKLVCALEGKDPEEMLYEYGDLVAIGTIADVMPLVEDNRSVVKCGLNLIAEGNRIGVNALLNEAGCDIYSITAGKVAFMLSPRLNAAGRMGDAKRGLELLITEDDEVAHGLAAALNSENIRRQSIEKQIMEEAVLQIEKNGYNNNRVIVVDGENWHSGVIGIVAARLVEKYGRPVIVLSVEENVANGSARSVSGFSIYNAIYECSYYLTKYGGHEMAAGVTLDRYDIDNFRKALNEYASKIDKVFPCLQLDCKLNPKALDLSLTDEIKELEPFGSGNPAPIFGVFGLTLNRINPVGQGKHLRLEFSREDTFFSAMLFSMTREAFPFEVGQTLDIAVALDVGSFQGEPNLTVNIKDIRCSGINEEKLFTDIEIYEDFKSGVIRDFGPITPERQEVADIYKTLLSGPLSMDKLIAKKLNTIGFAKTKLSVEALLDLNILSILENNGIPFLKVNPSQKVNLDDALTLKRLRGE